MLCAVNKTQARQWVGKRVVGEINVVCGRCDLCLSGLSNHCRNRTVLGILVTFMVHNFFEDLHVLNMGIQWGAALALFTLTRKQL